MESVDKTCRVCGSNNPPHARFCNNCGAALGAGPTDAVPPPKPITYDPHYGEADLKEDQLKWRGGLLIVSGLLLVIISACAATTLLAAGMLFDNPATSTSPEAIPSVTEAMAAAPVNDIPLATNTPRPTMRLETVTPAPPTITPTPTQGPCMIEVRAGSTLYEIMALCGHRDFDVMDEVMEINDLGSAAELQIGQMIEVPRPTPTIDPNAPTPTEGGEADGEASNRGGFASVLLAEGVEDLPTFTPSPSPTLPPGVQWHTVQPDENIIVIAYAYGGGVEVLSQLNPEVEFNQCDFGEFTGGPDCKVFLAAGQQLRVPAPTPTPTLSPTPSGSETATPTATATFNAPNLISPGERALFRRSELVTLRWAGTGTLGQNEVYRLRVTNLNTNVEFMHDLRESFFILPTAWQEQDGERHDYAWQVSVIDLDIPDDPIFTTETRTFTWEAVPGTGTPEGN